MGTTTQSMWGGRFKENPDEFMQAFGASIDIDIELLEVDVKGSIAWAEALGKAGFLSGSEVKTIVEGLGKVKESLLEKRKRGESFSYELEDVHMTVEAALTELIGDVGAKLHTGRSRNDQVACDERLYMLDALKELGTAIGQVQKAIIGQAENHIDSVVPSYTHLQQAQPVRLGHYLMSWFWMLQRDKERLADALKRTDKMPLGSGAVAGSGFPVDRTFLAEKLGFSAVTENSIDAVSDRDHIIETLSVCSILMMHLSRISEDLIIWSSAEFGFVTLPETYSTGSSMMPQKKNPDSLELVRGKTGRVYGNLVGLLTVMKGLPLSYGKDMQEDKEPLFDTLTAVRGCLRIIDGVVSGSIFRSEVMESVFDDAVFATDLADYLTLKGLPFRKAHEVAGSLVKKSQESGVPVGKLSFEDYLLESDLFEEDVFQLFDLRTSTDRRSLAGGTGKQPLVDQITAAKELIIDDRA